MHTFKNTLKASKSYIQEHKRNKGKPTKGEVMILHKIRRPNSLKTVPSGVVNYRNPPFSGGREKASRVGQGCVFHRRKTSGVATNVYLRKMSEKPKHDDLRILKMRVQELFTHGEGINTPHARHKGRQPLIECANDFKIMYFPLLCLFYVFLTFLCISFFFAFLCLLLFCAFSCLSLFCGRQGGFPSLLCILGCYKEIKPT